ncbi:Maf-like protein [Prevotella sp.]|uniref:Maf-like protein n=1 Tax=Prevotella sp. TaxID=59823 RepID=UPI0027E3114C|nr:Maf-like protein [Prevotella sp.]
MMKIILASNSPRRKELLGGLGVDFEVKVLKGVDESYPESLLATDVTEYIAAEKAAAYTVKDDELLITADTVVIVGRDILGKPADAADACGMLRELSGKTHQVVTGVCLTTSKEQRRFSVTTDVTFKQLSDAEINYYVDKYKPYDKAGAYGIQEWIGYIGVTALSGSYYNVMGFPVQRVYEELTTHFGLDFTE